MTTAVSLGGFQASSGSKQKEYAGSEFFGALVRESESLKSTGQCKTAQAVRQSKVDRNTGTC